MEPSWSRSWRAFAAVVALVGCGRSPGDSSAPTDGCADAPTWHQDVRPIVGERCSGCHTEGGIAADRPWTTYEEAQPWAALIAQTVEEGAMPPFIARDADDCVHRFDLMHDLRLDVAEIETLGRWAECGQREGDASNPAPVPEPPTFSLEEWDVEIAPPNGFVPERGDVEICFVAPVPQEWFADGQTVRWIEAMEILPEDLTAAHHIHAQVHGPEIAAKAGPEGWWVCTGAGVWGGIELGGWLPGSPPTVLPEGAAFPVRPDDIVAIQVHYHVSDDLPHYDQTKLRFRFSDAPIYEPLMYRVGNASDAGDGLLPGPNDRGAPEFRIPAGAVGHTETIRMRVPGAPGTEFTTFVVSNHMHQVGTSMKMWVEHDALSKAADEPLEECLLSTPRYDFGWQGFFYYDALSRNAPRIRSGDHVRIECTYDNSTGNAAWMEALAEEGLPQVPSDVLLGPTSLDEMCSSLVGALRLEP